MDLKLLLGQDYRLPETAKRAPSACLSPASSRLLRHRTSFDGGLCEIGYQGGNFSYDNERPQHKVYLEPFSLERSPISNLEYLEFMTDGGYKNALLWLSEGWKWVNQGDIEAPHYWKKQDHTWLIIGLGSIAPLEDVAHRPVTHISYYEADAFATWAGARLPTEFELEIVLSKNPALASSNFLDSMCWEPLSVVVDTGEFQHLWGNNWEWTCSDYAPYPHFKADFPEYNDKWFINQRVLRGGGFATPARHFRPTYRNFFHPEERWMFSGLRLAHDVLAE